MDLNFNWIEKKAKGRGDRNTDGFITIAVHRNGKFKDGSVAYQTVIVFHQKAISKFRLMGGDRLSIGFDKTAKLVALKRTTNENGYKVSKQGKSLRIQISFDHYPFLVHENIHIDNNSYFEQDGMFVLNLNKFEIKLK